VKKLVVVVAALAVAATPALAKTVAQGAQKTAIVHAAFGSKPPVKCYNAYSSTVNRAWASAQYAGSVKAPCARWGSNGIVILHRSGTHWRIVAEGSSFRCPVRGVPNPIERDLVPAPKCH
jgi:hypothetical protein